MDASNDRSPHRMPMRSSHPPALLAATERHARSINFGTLLTIALLALAPGCTDDAPLRPSHPDSSGQSRFWFQDSVVAVVEGFGALRTTVMRSTVGAPESVTVATKDGAATAGQDFRVLQKVLTFDPQDSAQTVTVEIKNDSVMEDTETFELLLRDASDGYAIPDSQSVAVIYDDEPRAPTTQISFPTQVGNRWIYAVSNTVTADSWPYSSYETRETWIDNEIDLQGRAFWVFRSVATDTLEDLYLRQEGQILYFGFPSALTDSSMAATLPWRMVDFLEGPGEADTVFVGRSDWWDHIVWTVTNCGRSAVQVPAGIFLDVQVVKVSKRESLGQLYCYSNRDTYYYIADAVGIVRERSSGTSSCGPGTSGSASADARLESMIPTALASRGATQSRR